MDKSDARERFALLAEAFDGAGGFAPRVTWADESVSTKDQFGHETYATRRVPKLASPCYIVPHPRESPEKFAARAAVAVYENHLREACERFVGYLGRRRPLRNGTDAPLVQLLLNDADMRGTPLDAYWNLLALQAKARGSMLLMIDMPGLPDEDGPVSLRDQIQRRAVPFLRSVRPEDLADYDVDAETGLFERVSLRTTEKVGGEDRDCTRTWDAEGWYLHCGEDLIASGPHPFGQCPFIAFTESGDGFPHIGKYAQIADMSRGIFNHRSRLDEILGSQTFSILTLQIPPESAPYNVMDAVATIGTSSMLTHQGITPSFVSPDQGNAETYLKVIEQLQQAIKRISADDATTGDAGGAESGIARRLRFERLNSDLANFAFKMQALETRMWALFHRALGTTNRVTVEWPTDFNLVDTAAELDILAAMQAVGMPEEALSLKRKAVVAAEFDAAAAADRDAVLAAIDAGMRERHATVDVPPVDLSPLTARIDALAAKIDAIPEPAAPPPAPAVDLAPLHQQIAGLQAAVEAMPAPAAHVAAPAADLAPLHQQIAALQTAVAAIQPPAAQAPQPLVINTGSGAQVIDLVRAEDGSISGAKVRQA